MTELEMARALLAIDRAVILTHRRPDGDTVGCAAALCRGLRQLVARRPGCVRRTRRPDELRGAAGVFRL